MTTRPEAAAYFSPSSAPMITVPGLYPYGAWPAADGVGLGLYPSAYRDLYPSLRSRFDVLGYAAFIPEGTFQVEEARFEALKVWATRNQEREEEVCLKTEEELERYIVNRAGHEAAWCEKAIVLLDTSCQIAEAELVKTKDRTLDKHLARKALADALRAEHERDITAQSLSRKAAAEADKAEAEVELVKCQHKQVEIENQKLQWETQLVEAEIAKTKAKTEKDKLVAEVQIKKTKAETEAAKLVAGVQVEKTNAEAAKLVSDAQIEREKAAMAKLVAEAAIEKLKAETAKIAAPSPAEAEQLLHRLEKLDPCPQGYPWVDKPDEGGFRCDRGAHFKSYEEARALIANK